MFLEFLVTLLIAYGVSLAGIGLVWVARQASDPQSDAGIGVFGALLSADILVALGAIEPRCFQLGVLESAVGDVHRTIACLLGILTAASAVIPLTCQREAREAYKQGSAQLYVKLTTASVMETSAVTSLHFVWIMRQLSRWELGQ